MKNFGDQAVAVDEKTYSAFEAANLPKEWPRPRARKTKNLFQGRCSSSARKPHLSGADKLARSAGYKECTQRELQQKGVENVSSVVDIGYGAEEITRLARKTPDNFIAMCTHDRSGVTRWVLGSVTERVVPFRRSRAYHSRGCLRRFLVAPEWNETPSGG